MTFLQLMPVLNIWLAARDKIKLKYLPVFTIRSDPIWKTVRVTVGAATAAALATAVAAGGSVDREGLAVQDRSSRRLCE